MVPGVNNEPSDGYIYNVAPQSVNVRIQKTFDPEVADLLDDSDMSRFGSDVEDLEEDFVVQANCLDQAEHIPSRTLNSVRICENAEGFSDNRNTSVHREEQIFIDYEYENYENTSEKPRVRRLLDEQFDLVSFMSVDVLGWV